MLVFLNQDSQISPLSEEIHSQDAFSLKVIDITENANFVLKND